MTTETILQEIRAERQRQMDAEGWTPEHDDEHDKGELASAAACYIGSTIGRKQYFLHFWPWDSRWWKPTTPERDLIKAAALIVAELERRARKVKK